MNINTKTTPPRRPRVYADWQLAADLFGQGFGVAEVAAALRCPVSKVQRNLRESRRFRHWIAEAEAQAALAADVKRRWRALQESPLAVPAPEVVPDLAPDLPAGFRKVQSRAPIRRSKRALRHV